MHKCTACGKNKETNTKLYNHFLELHRSFYNQLELKQFRQKSQRKPACWAEEDDSVFSFKHPMNTK